MKLSKSQVEALAHQAVEARKKKNAAKMTEFNDLMSKKYSAQAKQLLSEIKAFPIQLRVADKAYDTPTEKIIIDALAKKERKPVMLNDNSYDIKREIVLATIDAIDLADIRKRFGI